MLDTGPVTVVANFDATDRQWRYAKKWIIYLLYTNIESSVSFHTLDSLKFFCYSFTSVQYRKSNSIPDVGTLWSGK
jgi:hypothetical protein